MNLPNHDKERIKLYFSQLGRMKKTADILVKQVRENVVKGGSTVFLTDDIDPAELNYLTAHVLHAMGMPTFDKFSTYDFIQMHWKTHPEHNSYLYFESETVVVYAGFEKMQNKSEEAMAEDFLRARRSTGKSSIVFLKNGEFDTLQKEAENLVDKVVKLETYDKDRHVI